MPFSANPYQLFLDIYESINLIFDFVGDMSFDQYVDDPKTQDAVERRLLVISEAAVRLGDKADEHCPGQPWRDIRGIGNWLRHSYDRVQDETVWNTVKDDLPPLKNSREDYFRKMVRKPENDPEGPAPS